MSAPLVHIFSARLQDGKLPGFRQYAREHAAFAERVHPDVLAAHFYVSQDHREVHAVQLHPDADSMDLWTKVVVMEHGVAAYEYLEAGSERSVAYGPLTAEALAGMHQFGVDLVHSPEHLVGFTRLGRPE